MTQDAFTMWVFDVKPAVFLRPYLRPFHLQAKGGVELKSHWGGTLHGLSDLPFALKAIPGSYAEFKTRMQVSDPI